MLKICLILGPNLSFTGIQSGLEAFFVWKAIMGLQNMLIFCWNMLNFFQIWAYVCLQALCLWKKTCMSFFAFISTFKILLNKGTFFKNEIDTAILSKNFRPTRSRAPWFFQMGYESFFAAHFQALARCKGLCLSIFMQPFL